MYFRSAVISSLQYLHQSFCIFEIVGDEFLSQIFWRIIRTQYMNVWFTIDAKRSRFYRLFRYLCDLTWLFPEFICFLILHNVIKILRKKIRSVVWYFYIRLHLRRQFYFRDLGIRTLLIVTPSEIKFTQFFMLIVF